MPDPRPTRRRLLSLAGGALLAPAAVAAAEAEAVVAEVEAVLGSVRAAGSWPRTLAPGATLRLGERVETDPGGRIAIRLGRETRILLGSEAGLTLERYLPALGGQFTLAEGGLLYDRPEAARRIEAVVETPQCRIRARGTRFFAGPSRGAFGVLVERGTVVVEAAGAEVAVAAGTATEIAEPGAPPAAPRAWSQARALEALASVLF